MTLKYPPGTTLKCTNNTNGAFQDDFYPGRIITVCETPIGQSNSDYSIAEMSEIGLVGGWSPHFIEDSNRFVPINIKVTNWKERIKKGVVVKTK